MRNGVVVVATAVLAGGCLNFSPTNEYSAPPRASAGNVNEADIAAVESTDPTFAFDVLQRSRMSSGAPNTMVSPYALRILLAMIHADEEGRAAEEIATAARFTLPRPNIDWAFNAVDQKLASRTGSDGTPLLKLQRSVWWQKDEGWSGNWFDVIARYYGASVDFIDLSSDQGSMDDWVRATSGGAFGSSMNSGDNLAVEMSAAALNARWGASTTRVGSGPLFSEAGASVSQSFFELTSELPFASTDAYEAVEIPYEGGQLAMLVVVPREGRFADVVGGFDANFLASMDTTDTLVTVRVPEFDLTQSTDITGLLQAMGIVAAFDPATNETELATEPGQEVWLDPVHAQSALRVDGRGTQAAALETETLLVATTDQAPRTIPSKMLVVDRPFLFAIHDRPTGMSLFLGIVEDPTELNGDPLTTP